MAMRVHLVRSEGLVLAIYASEVHAEVHARTVTGAYVQAQYVLTSLPVTVSDDAASDDWDDAPTPVQEPTTDITRTQPSTPRSKAKSEPPPR